VRKSIVIQFLKRNSLQVIAEQMEGWTWQQIGEEGCKEVESLANLRALHWHWTKVPPATLQLTTESREGSARLSETPGLMEREVDRSRTITRIKSLGNC